MRAGSSARSSRKCLRASHMKRANILGQSGESLRKNRPGNGGESGGKGGQHPRCTSLRAGGNSLRKLYLRAHHARQTHCVSRRAEQQRSPSPECRARGQRSRRAWDLFLPALTIQDKSGNPRLLLCSELLNCPGFPRSLGLAIPSRAGRDAPR